ncbi:hypothetical protein HDU93_007371, partial [Gonapodya sp. JEL0774]
AIALRAIRKFKTPTRALVVECSRSEPSLPVVRSLVRRGICVQDDVPGWPTLDYKMYQVLKSLARRGCTELLLLLIESGASDTDPSSFGMRTVLWEAAAAHQTEVVRVLLERGHALSLRSMALYVACKSNAPADIVRLLLHAGTDADLDSALELSCRNYSSGIKSETVRLLVDQGASVDTKEGAPLLAACWFGSHELVVFLLDAGANVNGFSRAPLTVAANGGHLEVVKTLVARGADANAGCGEALYLAALRQSIEIVAVLLEVMNRREVDIVWYELRKQNDLGYMDISALKDLLSRLVPISVGINLVIVRKKKFNDTQTF